MSESTRSSKPEQRILAFFFFQAEDGIRARTVTGVQTCALPISDGHRYPVVDGIPVMLLDEVEQTLWVAGASLEKAQKSGRSADENEIPYADTLGIDPEDRKSVV